MRVGVGGQAGRRVERGRGVGNWGNNNPDTCCNLLNTLNPPTPAAMHTDIPTTICELTKEEAEEELNKVQTNFDFSVFKDPTVRIVGICGFRCPCGGTHVRSSKELEGFHVTGLKVKKGLTKVKYDRKK